MNDIIFTRHVQCVTEFGRFLSLSLILISAVGDHLNHLRGGRLWVRVSFKEILLQCVLIEGEVLHEEIGVVLGLFVRKTHLSLVQTVD